MSNENKGQELTVKYNIGETEIKLTPTIVQNYIVGTSSNITMQEFKFFTELCKVRKLNPFLKEAYCIKYGSEPATIVVGKDVIIKRAVNHPQYDGKETGIIVQDENGEIKERVGCFYAPSEAIVGGWAKVYRKDRSHPEYMSVSFEEVAQKKSNGELNSNWANKGATMIEKVAKVRALREAFVDELSGMYEAEEFGEEIKANPIVEAKCKEVVEQPEPQEETEVQKIEAVDISDI